MFSLHQQITKLKASFSFLIGNKIGDKLMNTKPRLVWSNGRVIITSISLSWFSQVNKGGIVIYNIKRERKGVKWI